MSSLDQAVARRRTFAIISHPDAGKTTLTEKLLLFGGAIQLAGAVKARGDARRARSDWMKVEQERGISVTASVMTFEYGDCTFNLLDTPGHQDFSEDTYRTLTAVDSAVMVIDSAKGIETQTRKLFEVCRLRDVPIVTFMNKLDREGREPFELMDEIERDLQLDVTPANWPIGMGRQFQGCYDLLGDRLILLDRGHGHHISERERVAGLSDPKLARLLPASVLEQLREEVAMTSALCPAFDREAYRSGHQTPVFFGSAIHNFGVRELLDALVELAPSPRPSPARERTVDPLEEKVSGFVFKIQANMDPKHRDRIAFMRLCSGRFTRGMKLFHVRAGRDFAVHSPVLFLARERELAEEAYAGDIIGVPNHGLLRIGDTLTEGEVLRFTGIPSFAPEQLQKVRPVDPMRAKHLSRALAQLAEEGAAQIFRTRHGSEWVVGVAGPLQFDVLADRVRTEYDVEARFEPTSLHTARWIEADEESEVKRFLAAHALHIADDVHGDPVYLAPSAWRMKAAEEDWPKLRFRKTKEHLQ
jgi:peptide chain release factor 3